MSRAQFSHKYQRPDGWIRRTVYADQDRVMVRFDGEAPYVMHHMRTVAGAADRVREICQREVNISHEWATDLNRRFDSRVASLIAATRRPPRGDVLVARRQEAA